MYDSQSGRSPADEIVSIDDLSLGTLIALVDRLRLTETPNQFLCREIEMDEAYLNADAELRQSTDEGAQAEALEPVKLIRSLVIQAHDFVGDSNISAAVDRLNQVIEMKIGL